MDALKKYSTEQLKKIVEKYPFFTLAKVELCKRSEGGDELIDLLRRVGVVELSSELEITPEEFSQRSVNSIIDNFLSVGEYKIQPSDSDADYSIELEDNSLDDEQIVSEELAEILLKQGLKQEAKQMYLKLSLLNPKKSVYFAGIISSLETN